jgi:hypothetical protein
MGLGVVRMTTAPSARPDRDREGAIAMQCNTIVGEAMREAFRWQCHQSRGSDYSGPLFAMPGVELPIVPRVALPRVEGAARRQARR